MKKMIVCAATIVVASMVQASAIVWAYSGVQTVAGGSSIGANASGFAFTGSAADRTAVLALFGTGTWAANVSAYQSGLANSQAAVVGSIGANANVALGGAGITSAAGAFISSGPTGSYGGVTAADSFASAVSESLFVVVFDNANWTLATFYSVSVLNTQTLGASGAKNYATTWANFGGTGVAGTWAVVPEPTSMALLALGAAALGLRRKFRK